MLKEASLGPQAAALRRGTGSQLKDLTGYTHFCSALNPDTTGKDYAKGPSLSAHLNFWEAEAGGAEGSRFPISSSSGPRALFASEGPSSSF